MIAAAVLAAALTLTVSPRVALAGADVAARVQVDPTPTARWLVVELVGLERSQVTERPYEPSDRRQTVYVPAWRHLPAGTYAVVATLVDAGGQVVAREIRQVEIRGGE